MSKYFKIVQDSEPSLRERCTVVENPDDDSIIELVNKMHDYLVASQDPKIKEKYQLKEGVGLAAPQIGENIRALVVYYPIEEDEDGNPTKVVDHRLINPRIISESVKESYLGAGEGCLSVKENHEGYVYRKFKIIVKAFDAVTRKEKIITARGYEAIVLQHELDHLNGVLYYDHINKENPFIRKEDAIRI